MEKTPYSEKVKARAESVAVLEAAVRLALSENVWPLLNHKVHIFDKYDRAGYCGRGVRSVTEYKELVTCKVCLKAIAQGKV